jgi:tetratricopeptide (TPR) repeat protein
MNNLAWLLADAEEPSDEDLDRAMRLAQEAGQALPNNPSVSDTLGWVMLKKNIPSAAISLFQAAIGTLPEGHPLHSTLRFHLAQAYEKNGDIGKAIAELTRVIDEAPQSQQPDEQSLQARIALAGLYLQTGENELAAREARRSAAASPGDSQPTLILAGALIGLQQPEQALEALEPIGQGAGLAPAPRLDLARLRRRAGDLSGARSILGELLESADLRAGPQAELIDCDLQERKHREAIARLDGWISQERERAELYLLRGRVRLGLVSAGELAQSSAAEADLKAAIDKGLAGIQAHLLLASLYLETGASDTALQALDEAGSLAPRDERVPTQLREAIAAFPAADPLRGSARYQLAQVYQRNGEIDRAIAELTRALDEVPSFAEREATEELLRQLSSS